jgi:hypothetical protein
VFKSYCDPRMTADTGRDGSAGRLSLKIEKKILAPNRLLARSLVSCLHDAAPIRLSRPAAA